MTATVIKRVKAAGQTFVVFADPNNEYGRATSARSELLNGLISDEIDGVIRAVPTRLMANIGAELLCEEPNAKWFIEQEDLNGTLVKLSGDGLRAFVHFLLNTGLHKVVDRRETVPIATSLGIRDTLVGLTGVSVDLGRWRMVGAANSGLSNASNSEPNGPATSDELPEGMKIKLGRTHTVTFAAPKVYAENHVLIDPESILRQDGIAQVSAKFYRGEGRELGSSGTGAAVAALAARHISPRDMPNHWKVQTARGSIAVRMFATEEGEHVSINGPAEMID